jgi:hypothetical protein
MPDLNPSIRDIPIPPRMAKRPISDRGFPVPWFARLADISSEGSHEQF